MRLKYICNFVWEEKCEENWPGLGINILRSGEAISFNFVMWSSVWKYINVIEISIVIFEIPKAEFGNFTVLVNNTPVCHAPSFVFLAADTVVCLDTNLVLSYCLLHEQLNIHVSFVF